MNHLLFDIDVPLLLEYSVEIKYLISFESIVLIRSVLLGFICQ